MSRPAWADVPAVRMGDGWQFPFQVHQERATPIVDAHSVEISSGDRCLTRDANGEEFQEPNTGITTEADVEAYQEPNTGITQEQEPNTGAAQEPNTN